MFSAFGGGGGASGTILGGGIGGVGGKFVEFIPPCDVPIPLEGGVLVVGATGGKVGVLLGLFVNAFLLLFICNCPDTGDSLGGTGGKVGVCGLLVPLLVLLVANKPGKSTCLVIAGPCGIFWGKAGRTKLDACWCC